MALGLFKSRAQRQQESTLCLFSERAYKDSLAQSFGIRETALGADASLLVAVLYDYAENEHHRQFPDNSRHASCIESVPFVDHDWVHPNFLEDRVYNSHNFHLELHPLTARASVQNPSQEAEADIQKKLQKDIATRIQIFDASLVQRLPPYEGLQWDVGRNFADAYRSFVTGSFRIGFPSWLSLDGGTKGISVPSLVHSLGAKLLDLFRAVTRKAMTEEIQTKGKCNHRYHYRLSFPTDDSFIVMSSSFYGGSHSLPVGKGFFESDRVLHISYLGLQSGKGHPECKFAKIEEAVQAYFPPTK